MPSSRSSQPRRQAALAQRAIVAQQPTAPAVLGARAGQRAVGVVGDHAHGSEGHAEPGGDAGPGGAFHLHQVGAAAVADAVALVGIVQRVIDRDDARPPPGDAGVVERRADLRRELRIGARRQPVRWLRMRRDSSLS